MTRIVLLLVLFLLLSSVVPDGLSSGPYNTIYGSDCFLSGTKASACTGNLRNINRKQSVKEIALERIQILVAVALKEKQDPALASRQAFLAKKVAMRHRVRMPYEIRQLYCKKCKAFIVPGRTARVRTGNRRRSGKAKAVRITCSLCGHTYRKVINIINDAGGRQ